MQKWKAQASGDAFRRHRGVGDGRRKPAATRSPSADPAPPRRLTRLPRKPEQKADPRAEIIRENNFGVALMNRQQFEKALGKFQRACILDPETDWDA